MRKIQIIILSLILLNSCCDSDNLNDYDHVYDNYLPIKGQENIYFYHKSDTNNLESLEVTSDITETVELKVNGDGCTENFNQRILKLDLPKTDELDFTLSTGGMNENLSMEVFSSSVIVKIGYLGYYSYDDIYPDSIDAFLNEMKINGQKYNNVMRFSFTSNNSPDVDKIFIAEHFGFIMITYNNGDTLLRK